MTFSHPASARCNWIGKRDRLGRYCHPTDERWETRIEAELGLERIEVPVDLAACGAFPLKLEVWGIADPLGDQALVGLVRRSFAYRSEPGIMVFFPDRKRDDRMAFAREGTRYATIDDFEYECYECATEAIMDVLKEARRLERLHVRARSVVDSRFLRAGAEDPALLFDNLLQALVG